MIPLLVAALLLSTPICPENQGALETGGTGTEAVAFFYPSVTAGSTASRWDVVFVGDGFTESPEDVANFEDLISRAVKALSSAPYQKCAFNFYAVRLRSNESRADHVVGDDPVFGDPSVPFPLCRDTPLNTRFGAPEKGSMYDDYRYLYTATEDRCEEAAELVTDDCDLLVVVVNDTTYGGAAWRKSPDIPIVTVSACEEFEHVLLHEMGHQIANLGDEYGGWPGCYTTTYAEEPDHPNVTTKLDAQACKWKLDEGVRVPTDLDRLAEDFPGETGDELKAKVGEWEGASGYEKCIYRPQYTCRMREEVPFFCRVCDDAIAAAMTAACPTIEPIPVPWSERIDIPCRAGSRVIIPPEGPVKPADFGFHKETRVRVEIGPLPGVRTVRVVEYPSRTVLESGPDPGSSSGAPGAHFVLEFVAKPQEFYFLEFTPRTCLVRRFSALLSLYVYGVDVH